MIYIFKLVRIQNLLIIAFAQYLFRYAILIPVMKMEQISPALSNINFALLVISTVLIAAAGYAINDYFDLRVDRINRPSKIIIGKYISRRKVMLLHTVLNIIAILIGAYVSYKAGSIKLAAINIVMATVLWLYSLKYKAYFLVGNILVSFATGMTLIVVWLFEMYALHSSGQIVILHAKVLSFFVWAYFIFAFGISLIREIIKDIEDIEGDKKCGCSTLPIVLGISKTKFSLIGLIIFFLAMMGYMACLAYLQNLKFLFWYLNIAVILPFIYLGYVVIVAKNKDDFVFLSMISKFIMIAGVLSMLLIFQSF